ncbi:hypothetical protein KFL_002630110 [Klebsormidium nitens]|uniref:Uncharacterized protein n=1 Tax=Klebsormidium nitens TaxID=105231 RepID=A0A1Y1IB68_KLENI|nr:hypothetical protein KFL_002630110 [Klebsormidium nitens]|eukprot:GAQ85967.1 hypothetical protein KFL_002630110 [Klebsormidium nitens]
MNFFGRRLSLDTSRNGAAEDSPVSTPVGTPTSPGMWKGNPQLSSSKPINIPQGNSRMAPAEDDRTPSLLQSASSKLLARAQSAPNPHIERPTSYDERADPESNVIGERLLWWLLFPPGNF